MIRDYALASSGLLVRKIGGPSVKPYMPDGVWEAVAMIGSNTRDYRRDTGEKLYRRSMYTFWKRAAPPASMDILNAPNRETCTTRRERTNTPLQALVLLNDPTYVEASRKFAERLLTEAQSDKQRIDLAFQLAMARPPSERELALLLRIYQEQIAVYRQNHEAASKLLSVGESVHNESLDDAELAAWTIVASVILNLDKTITKG